MAGQPRKRAFLDALTTRTREYFEGDPSKTHLDYCADWVSGGQTLLALARLLWQEAHLPGETMPALLTNYLRSSFPDYDATMREARRAGAHAKAESTEDIAAERVGDSADAARARNRIGAAQFLAERWNREDFGRERGPSVSVSIDARGLHLGAMQARTFGAAENRSQLAERSDSEPAATLPATMGQPASVADLL